jgi:hypothetical protein
MYYTEGDVPCEDCITAIVKCFNFS